LGATKRRPGQADHFIREGSSVVPDASGRPPLRRHGQHDDAERNHRQPYEFKYQRFHGNIPQ
jgi:hypothetical protein